MENAYITITDSKILENIFYARDIFRHYLYDFCHFQFYRVDDKNYNSTLNTKKQMIIQITSVDVTQIFNRDAGNINCKLYKDSLYNGFNPLQVYLMHFKFTNSSNKFQFTTGFLCKCQGSHRDCYTNLLQPIYPGQTLKLKISLNNERIIADKLPIIVKVYDIDSPHTICKVSSLLEAEQEVYQNCTIVTYDILSENTQYCKLILYNVNYDFPVVYCIKMLKCPAGFEYSKLEKKCVCDRNLNYKHFLIKVCEINFKVYNVLLTVGYLLQLIMIPTLITFPYIVHSTTAYLTHHISTSPLLTHNVSLTDLVSCVATVNKVSVLSLVH